MVNQIGFNLVGLMSMENSMISTLCPYCQNGIFLIGSLRRPDQRVDQCQQCQKYVVTRLATGQRYPLGNPLDPSSMPQMTMRS